MLELEFASAGDEPRDKTDASGPAVQDRAPEEVDSHCPSCDRRFKVDRAYLEMGNQAKCPHCAVDLEFDRSPVDHDKLLADLADELAQPDEGGSDLEDEEVLAQASRGLDELPSLDDEELGDDDLSFDDEVDDGREEDQTDEEVAMEAEDLDASSPTTAEIPSKQGVPRDEEQEPDYEAEDAADDFSEKTDILPDTRPDHQMPDDVLEPLEDESGWDEEEEDSDQVLLGSDEGLDRGEAEEDEEERPTVALFGNQERGGEEGSGDGLFSGLATSRDWASAAAEWAESGFKAEDMPRFIKGQPGEEGEEELREDEDAEPSDESDELPESPRDSISAVEVSDADIMVPEQLAGLDEDTGEEEYVDGPTVPEQGPPAAGKREPTEPVIRDPKVKRARAEAAKKKARQAKPEAKKKTPSRLKSPTVWIPLVVGVLVVGVVLYLFLSPGEADPETSVFSTEGLQVTVVEAPVPSDYSAKDDAVEHYGQGNQYAYQGYLEDAVREYQQALRLDPGYPHPHRALGSIYAALGKVKLSRSEYETYLKLAPKSADASQVQTIIDSYNGK